VVLALVVASAAPAKLAPVRRPVGETSLPRVRAGVLHVPPLQASDLTRVIVRLPAPPLAVWFAQRRLASASAAQHLDVQSASARTYLAHLARLQRVAAVQVKAAVPDATLQQRFRIVLDGITVQLRAAELPKLLRVRAIDKIYPSLRYTMTDDTSPAVIHATQLEAATGDQGAGIKIGVVDTGVDPKNPFLNPAGFSYPAGFPKGDTRYTTPKVIVARVFPGPVRDKRSNQVFDPTEPHGTHVAGIAAGDQNVTAPAGPDHPRVTGLSGVAPRAWIGNYRVFTIPTPLGHEADTPQIVQAFESAVADGMNVINFSGGGPQTDPANDAMYEAVHDTALAGVVPVIAAGNDRDDFGLGTTGSPGTVPDAITVAAVSNAHVFAPALSVPNGPPQLTDVPIQSVGGTYPPASWATADQPIVDISTVVGTNHKPVDPYLCGSPSDPNNTLGTLPKNSVKGLIVLVHRGNCSFVSKAERAVIGGAAGMILIDNRPGEANPVPVQLPLRGGMISDLDGQRLQAYLDANGGRGAIRVSAGIQEIPTGRSGIMTSFSSAGLNDFGFDLKPDISAPGLDVLSSTPPLTTGSNFAVFAGTSMATPHVAGAAALLLQQHPTWSPYQVKSALMDSAAPAWGNTARTQEAPVLLEGAGLADLTAATDPHVFTDPQSLSFEKLDLNQGAQQKSLLLTVSDAGGGAGNWTVTVAPQSQTSGVTIGVPATISLTPGGSVPFPVTVNVAANAGTGFNYGFVVLSNGSVQRRVPYAFLVEKPALASAPVVALRKFQVGSTAVGTNRVSQYCCPSEPFGPPPSYFGAPMNEDGAEHLYSLSINQPVLNFGVSILAQSSNALVDPWVLGSKDENDVEGYAGTPVDVNTLTVDSNLDVGAAGAEFPRLGTFYVSVDSRTDPFTNKPHKGQYLLNSWVNDVTPPYVRLLTTRVTAGRPLIIGQAVDLGAGVDPLSLVLNYGRVLIGASQYDPVTGLVLFGIPTQAPTLAAGKRSAIVMASDYQESKNVNTVGPALMPNTTFKRVRLTVVSGPTVTWLAPQARSCVTRPEHLLVTADSTAAVREVVFRDDGRKLGTRKGTLAFELTWKDAHAAKGVHRLTATVVDVRGRTATAERTVRVCR